MFRGGYEKFEAKVAAERRDDLPVSELQTLEDVLAWQALKQPNRPFSDIPAFVPTGWKRKSVRSVEDICDAGNFPLMEKKSTEGGSTYQVCAAGGAVYHSLFYSEAAWENASARMRWPNDVDYFVAIDPAPEGSLDRDREEILLEVLNRYPLVHEKAKTSNVPYAAMARGIVTFTTEPTCEKYIPSKVQFVLRGPFKTPAAVISGFDLGPSSVVMWRDDVEADDDSVLSPPGDSKFGMTWRGAYAAATSIDIIPNLEVRSTTFATRIAKYFNRGVGFAFPNISPEEIQRRWNEEEKPFEIELLDFTIKVLKPGHEKNMWESQIIPTNFGGVTSDYDPIGEVQLGSFEAGPTYWYSNGDHVYVWGTSLIKYINTNNVRKLAYILGYVEREPGEIHVSNIPSTLDELCSYLVESIEHYDTITGVIRTICGQFGRLRKKDHYSSQNLSEQTYVDLLGMTIDQAREYLALRRKVQDMLRGSHYTEASMVKVLEPFIEKILARYEELRETRLDWWIVDEPGRQWTASLNPAIVEPKVWYGPWYYERPKLQTGTSAQIKENPKSAKDNDNSGAETTTVHTVEETTCPLCLTPIIPGDTNTMTLPCGHCFCWSRRIGSDGEIVCDGYITWHNQGVVSARQNRLPLTDRSNTCPACRSVTVAPNPNSIIGNSKSGAKFPSDELVVSPLAVSWGRWDGGDASN